MYMNRAEMYMYMYMIRSYMEHGYIIIYSGTLRDADSTKGTD